MDLTASRLGLAARRELAVAVDREGGNLTASTPRSRLVEAVERLGRRVESQPRRHASTARGRRLDGKRAIAVVSSGVGERVDSS